MKVRQLVLGTTPRVAVGTWGLALAVLLGALMTWGATAPAEAAPRLEVQVVAGYDNFARQDDWTPVRVTVKNNGGDFRGVLRIDEAGGASQGFGQGKSFAGFGNNCCGVPVAYATRQVDVVVPAGGTRHYTLYVAGVQTPRASLLEGGTSVASGELSQALTYTSSTSLLVAVVSDQADTLDHLSLVHLGGAGTVHRVRLKPSELAGSGILLRSFNAIAFDDASTDALTADQRTALRDYVEGGGGLLLVGGPSARKTLAGIPPALQPVSVSGVAQDDLRSVAGLAGAAVPAAGATISTGALAHGAHAVSSAGVPVLAWLPVGSGNVVYSAVDPASEPISSWAGERTLLRELVNRATGAHPPDGKGFNAAPTSRTTLDYGSVSSVLNNLPSLDVPAAGLVGWLLLGYALLIGPVNYFVLKRLHRRHLAWVTIPVMVAVASASVLVVGLNVKGVGTQVNQVRLVQLTPGDGRAYAVTYTGVVVPHRGDYRVSLPDTGYFGSAPVNFHPGNDAVTIQGEPPEALLPAMTAYSVRAVASEGYAGAGGSLAADVHVAGNTLSGTLTNNTAHEIEDAAVVFRGAVQQLGVLRPGRQAAVSLTSTQGRNGDIASTMYPQSFGGNGGTQADRDRQRRAQVVRALTNNNFGVVSQGAQLIGFEADQGTAPRIDGHEVNVRGESAVVMNLPLAADPRATTVSPGDVVSRLVDYDGNIQSFPTGLPGAASVQVAAGSATLEFDLPGGGWQTADVGVTIPAFNFQGTNCLAPSVTPVPPPPPGNPSGTTVQVPPIPSCQSGQPTLSVFNFSKGQWDPVNAVRSGRLTLNPASGQVSPDGAVLLRFSAPGNGSNVLVQGTSIAATRPAAF